MGGFLFFRYLQKEKSDLLDFRAVDDEKWQIVHGWLLRLIAVFATYASPTIATSFGRYRKLLHLGSVATMACLTARSTANRPVRLSHRSL
jgi:hypothetical protein